MTVTEELVDAIDAADPTTIPRLRDELRELRLDVARLNTEVCDEHTQLQEVRAEGEREIVRLNEMITQQRERAERAERDVEAASQAHHKDIAKISDVLIEEADERDWCDEYDGIISRLNRILGVPLRMRQRAFVLDVQVTFTTSFEVQATSLDDAEQIIRDAETSLSWHVSSPFISGDISHDGMYGHNIEVEVV